MSWTQFNSEFPKTELSWVSFFARIHEGLLRDSWRIVGWIGQYFKCCNWNFNVARKVFAKKSLPNIFSRNKIYPKIWRNSTTNKIVETNLTKNIWPKSTKKSLKENLDQTIPEEKHVQTYLWRKTRANISLKKNLCQENCPKQSLKQQIYQKNLKKHLYQQNCWNKYLTRSLCREVSTKQI